MYFVCVKMCLFDNRMTVLFFALYRKSTVNRLEMTHDS